MSPWIMTVLLLAGWGLFAYSAHRRWRLLRVARRPECRCDGIGRRVGAVLRYVVGQQRMFRYSLPGVAHAIIFFGFIILLLNSLILWGRGYDQDFSFGVFGADAPLGVAYGFLRDVFTALVLVGVLVFAYYRLIGRLQRLTLNVEGAVILAIIFTMMVADFVYEGAEIVRAARPSVSAAATFHATLPFGSLFAALLAQLPAGAVDGLWHAGFWAHSGLVLLFLNLLPYGKHFHVITVLPNVFFANPQPRGRLAPITDIEGKLERSETLGVKTMHDFSWKDALDFYTCTECGRCSDHCPATNTGKLLSPKHLTIDLRDHLYRNERALLRASSDETTERRSDAGADSALSTQHSALSFVRRDGQPDDSGGQLMNAWIDPEVVWACTTCGACEQECPVLISYIDKIVDFRRNLVMEQGEFPGQLQNAFRGLESVANVYSFPNEQRAEWAAGLDVPLRADRPDAEWLYWVGCAPSFDDRSRKIARAFATLLKEAGVSFAILGPEERCNGDPARRAGNEYLFQTLAQANIETLNGYAVKKIVTTCPHCFNTLKNEYPDFGGHYEVVHHTVLLEQLVRAGKLRPTHAVPATIAYHDACYLGRHNDIYDPPRELLRAIPGLRVVEPAQSRDRGMCCGAGGAQMWKEEEHTRRPGSREGDGKVNHARVRQLLRVLPAEAAASGAGSCKVASSCPFCLTMLTDGLRDQGHDEIEPIDIAELLLRAVKPG